MRRCLRGTRMIVALASATMAPALMRIIAVEPIVLEVPHPRGGGRCVGGGRSAVRPARQGGQAAAGASVGNVSGPYPGVRLAGSGLLSNQYRRSLHLDTSFSYVQYSTLEHDDFIPSFSGTSDPQHSCLIFRNTARQVAIINDIRLPDRVKLHLPTNTLLSIRKRKRHSAAFVFFYSQITVFDFTKLVPVVSDLYFCDFHGSLLRSLSCSTSGG